MKRYGVVVLDPPWPDFGGGGRGAQNHYPLASIDWIASLDIPSILLPDAHVYVWTTSSNEADTYRWVLPSWGVEPVVPTPWVKGRRAGARGIELDHFGLGRYTRKVHETLILCRRGSPPGPWTTDATIPDSLLVAPKGRHSAKPLEETMRFIEALSAGVEGPRLSVFASDQTDELELLRARGWDWSGLDRDGAPLPGGAPMPVAREGWGRVLRSAQDAMRAAIRGQLTLL